ncbi:MAG: hypothetical protein IKS03_04580 [Ruminococcus sp.]|nr:hypothetical protein [Ruminococcus sp.]
MSIFTKIADSISGGLFRFIVLRNIKGAENIDNLSEKIPKLLELGERVSELEKLCGELKSIPQKESPEESEEKIREKEEKEKQEKQEKEKFATKQEVMLSIKKLVEEINKKDAASEYKDKIDILTATNNSLVNENSALRSEVNAIKEDMEKLSSIILAGESRLSGEEPDSDENIPRKSELSELSVSETIDLFMLSNSRNKVMVNSSVSSVRNYMKNVLDFDKIEECLKINKDHEGFSSFAESFGTFSKLAEQKAKELAIMLEDIKKDDISAEITVSLFKIISAYIIERWIPVIFRLINEKRDEKYIKLLKVVNEYLENVGVYTYNKLRKNEKITEESLDYFLIARCPSPSENLSETVKEIKLLPYCINYTEYGEKTAHHTMGSAEIYSAEEKI